MRQVHAHTAFFPKRPVDRQGLPAPLVVPHETVPAGCINGMKAMRSASGIQALYAAFASGEHQVMVAEGDENRLLPKAAS
jgi:hypothetical protein